MERARAGLRRGRHERLGGRCPAPRHRTPLSARSASSSEVRPRRPPRICSLCSPEARGAPIDHPVGPGQVHRESLHPDVAHQRMVDRRPQSPVGRHGVMVDPVLRHGDGGGRHPGREHQPRHLVPVPGAGPAGELLVELVLLGQAAFEVRERAPRRPTPRRSRRGRRPSRRRPGTPRPPRRPRRRPGRCRGGPWPDARCGWNRPNRAGGAHVWFTPKSRMSVPVKVAPVSVHAMSTHWPSPVRLRWTMAASTARAM